MPPWKRSPGNERFVRGGHCFPAELVRLPLDLGEQGPYRIIFAALSETDDRDVKQTLRRLYRRYHERVAEEIARHRKQRHGGEASEDGDTAWALIGLVAFMNIALELELMSGPKRRRLFSETAWLLLDVGTP